MTARAACTAGDWAEALAAMARDIDYSNFKATVAARRGKKRANVYWNVRAALLPIEDDA